MCIYVLYIRTCVHLHVQTHSYTHITAALDTFPSLPSKRLLLNLGEKHVNMITQRPVRCTQSCREAWRRRTDMAVGTKSTALLLGPEEWALRGTQGVTPHKRRVGREHRLCRESAWGWGVEGGSVPSPGDVSDSRGCRNHPRAKATLCLPADAP